MIFHVQRRLADVLSSGIPSEESAALMVALKMLLIDHRILPTGTGPTETAFQLPVTCVASLISCELSGKEGQTANREIVMPSNSMESCFNQQNPGLQKGSYLRSNSGMDKGMKGSVQFDLREEMNAIHIKLEAVLAALLPAGSIDSDKESQPGHFDKGIAEVKYRDKLLETGWMDSTSKSSSTTDNRNCLKMEDIEEALLVSLDTKSNSLPSVPDGCHFQPAEPKASMNRMDPTDAEATARGVPGLLCRSSTVLVLPKGWTSELYAEDADLCKNCLGTAAATGSCGEKT